MGLKQQIVVLKRTAKRASITDSDRLFWVLKRRFHKDWKNCQHIVKPDTGVRWHNQGFPYYWRWKPRAKPVRPPVPWNLIWLIKRLSRQNPLWGALHIEKELAPLGHQVGKTTVAKYMERIRKHPSLFAVGTPVTRGPPHSGRRAARARQDPVAYPLLSERASVRLP
jgi:hypothetical protein